MHPMDPELVDGEPTADLPRGSRCRHCNRSGPRCFCARLPRIANRTAVLILQHPREQRHRAGTAPFVVGSLQDCEVVVARDHDGKIVGEATLGPGTALLFPGEGSVDVASLPPEARPRNLVVIDGTWSQAKRLYHDNPWLAALPKVHLDPERPSSYLVRREPRADYLSTVESVVESLGALEPQLVGDLRVLREVFESVMREQYGLMTADDRTPRMQRPRQRVSRAIPAAFLETPFWVVHTEQVWCAHEGRRALQPVHWAALEVGTGRRFEAVLRPEVGEPDAIHLGHIGITPEAVGRGESLADARARFRELTATEAPSLCAWSRLPLRNLRRVGLTPGRELLVKVLCANLRGPLGGGPEMLCERLGLRPAEPEFMGRGARRIGAVWSLAEWVREQGRQRITSSPG